VDECKPLVIGRGESETSLDDLLRGEGARQAARHSVGGDQYVEPVAPLPPPETPLPPPPPPDVAPRARDARSSMSQIAESEYSERLNSAERLLDGKVRAEMSRYDKLEAGANTTPLSSST